MIKDNDGYIVVETAGAFIPFALLVISILSLVNIVTLQVRMHYALTQTAGALSMYCYVLEATGAADGLSAMDKKGSAFRENIDAVLGGIETLSGGGSGLSDAEGMYEAAEAMAGNPKEMIQGLANYGLGELREAASAALVKPLFRRYLGGPSQTADDYLKKMRIISFEFADCVIIDGNDNVKLTAEYEVEYTFGSLRLPFVPTLRISQTVVTKAWLGGSGKGYGS